MAKLDYKHSEEAVIVIGETPEELEVARTLFRYLDGIPSLELTYSTRLGMNTITIQEREEYRMMFHIWSNEHNAWWAPHCSGYVEHRSAAGHYSYDEAKKICEKANIAKGDEDAPDETLVPIV